MLADAENVQGRAVDTYTTRRLLLIILLAWLAVLGFDLFLHAGLLARLYLDASAFLLTPMESFRRIPIGYLSFLVSTILLVWLMVRLDLKGWRVGLGFGMKLGALVWGALTLGLYSISTADPSLLAGWFLGQTAELGLAGAVTGSALAGNRLGRLSLKVAGLILLLTVITIIMQSTGLAPAADLRR
jgi:hypothetical protein